MRGVSWNAIGLCALKILGLVAGYLTVLIVLSLIWVLGPGKENYPASLDAAMEPLQIMGGLAFTGCVILFYRRKKLPFLEAAGLVRPALSIPELFLFAGYGILLNLFFVILLNLLPAADTAAYGISVSEALLGGDFRLAFLIILFYSPFAEELFFRGLALTYLKGCMKPYYAAALISIVFGLTHIQPLWVGYAMIMGMLFSCITLRINSIVPSIIAHFFFNATSLTLFIVSQNTGAGRFWGLPVPAVWIIFAAVAILTVWLTKKLYALTGRDAAHAS